MKTIAYADLTPADIASVKYWGEPNAEELHYDDPDEALTSIFDNVDTTYLRSDEIYTIHGWVPMTFTPKASDADWALEYLLENWDEEYGNPDVATTVTDGMKKAAQQFVDAIRAEYHVWCCEPILAVTVPVREWVESHNPEWLKEDA